MPVLLYLDTMASNTIDFNRNIIPTWHTYEETSRAGELEFSREVATPVRFGRFTDYVEVWKVRHDINSASDLVNAGLVSGNSKSLEVKESAYFIKTHENQTSKLVQDVAGAILNSEKSNDEGLVSTGFDNRIISLLGQFDTQKAAIKARIGLIRKQLFDFCYNPIAYCELARYFMDLGMLKKAEYYMRIALHLAPNHRYVTRCGARFYLHLGRPDIARHILVKNAWVKFDPWVMASEIAVESVMEKSSQYLKKGRQLVLSGSISPFSSSELSLAICKEDIKADKRSDSRVMFSKGMIKPNENSLAQAESFIRLYPSFEIDYDSYEYLNNRNEADTRLLYNKEDFKGAYESSLYWLLSYRFSKEPVSFAFDIASTFLKRYDDSIRILDIGLDANPGDVGFLNNKAYAYGLLDKPDDAENVLSQLDIESVLSQKPSIGICLFATTGLIRYRQSRFDEARRMYFYAIDYAKKIGNDQLADKARLNMIREEVRNVKDYDTSILGEIDSLDTGSKAETDQIKKDILDEVVAKR